jgi:hypothetical protein
MSRVAAAVLVALLLLAGCGRRASPEAGASEACAATTQSLATIVPPTDRESLAGAAQALAGGAQAQSGALSEAGEGFADLSRALGSVGVAARAVAEAADRQLPDAVDQLRLAMDEAAALAVEAGLGECTHGLAWASEAVAQGVDAVLRGEFLSAARALCVAADDAISSLSVVALRSDLRYERTATIKRRLVADLRGLPWPRGDAARLAGILEESVQAAAKLDEAAALLRSGNRPAFLAAFDEASRLTTANDAGLTEYGLADCAAPL